MRRSTPKIALRVGGAFAIILGFFAVALLVTDRILHKIGEAEHRVERLDRAKHAGHHVAAMAREMYIHQAHTILNSSMSHLDHYEQWVEATREGTKHLREISPTPKDRAQAENISALAELIDAEFRREIIPAIQRGDRTGMLETHERIDAIRRKVITANRRLSADFEQRALDARVDAEALRARARLGILGCMGFAALAAIVLGSLLLRSILQPISVLRASAQRVAGGDLAHRIDWSRDDELGDLADTFNSMTEDLQRHQTKALDAQRLRILGGVTAGVAHELNNPLGVILGYLKLIERDGNPSPSRLATITDEAKQCQRIVAELLEVVRPTDLEPSSVDLGKLARETVDRLRAATHHTSMSVDAETGILAWGDPNRLRQVLDNLVSNAIEASPEADVTVTVGTLEGQNILRVRDGGPGVPEDIRDRLFDPFFTTKADGTGLGLAISRAIIEAHDGELLLVPSFEGACFEINLPRWRNRGADA